MLNLLKFIFRITGIYQLFITLARRRYEILCSSSDQDQNEEAPENDNNAAVPGDSFYQKHIKEKLCRGLHKLLMQEEMIIIHRIPPRTVLRAHLLGLTIALSFVIFTMISGIKFPEGVPIPSRIEDCLKIFDCFELIIGNQISASGELLIILLLIFIIGTYVGGPFVIFIAILYSLYFILNLLSNFEFLQSNVLVFLSKWFLLGYSVGVVLGLIYNDLVFLHTHFFNNKFVKISLAAFRQEDLNVIKSPYQREEKAIHKLFISLIYYLDLVINDVNKNVNGNILFKKITNAYLKSSEIDKQEFIRLITGRVSANPDVREPDITPAEWRNYLNQILTTDYNANPGFFNKIDTEIEPLSEKYLNLKQDKLYNFKIKTRPKKPYTIVFVANPYFCTQFPQPDPQLTKQQFKTAIELHRNNPQNFIPDPIMKDKELFYRTVDRALFSFQNDEVLGSPEIWSRIRIITIFPEKLINIRDRNHFGLVEAIQDRYLLDNRLIENISVPLLHEENTIGQNGQQIAKDSNYVNILQQYQREFQNTNIAINNNEIDIVFALSKTIDYDRSTAFFANGTITLPGPDIPGHSNNNRGESYIQESPGISGNTEVQNDVHEYKSEYFGKVALNVIGLRNKVFIHEFAHAMSSNDNGAIVDEYFDQMIIGSTETPAPYAINRLQRDVTFYNYNLNPVPDIFKKYNAIEFRSDLDHPSAEEFWIGYFPQRTAPFIGCTMDRTIGHYQFDPLIKRFMYDRIIAKLNRP